MPARPITKNWSVDIDDTFTRRVEDGSLVFWKPGTTAWINCWGNGVEPGKADAIQFIHEDANPDRVDVMNEDDGVAHRFVYLLTEWEGSKWQDAVYSYTIVEGEYIQMAVYFDDKQDQAAAIAIAKSPTFTAYTPQ